MSLLSTSSRTTQEAYLYENHYPQPIVIAPNSQICLQKFIHYRGALYEVNNQNNVIGYRFGTGGTNQDVPRFVSIPTGGYEGSNLAAAIETALNSVNQQQNYTWTVDFTPAPSTDDDDQFQITYTSVPTPTVNSGLWDTFQSGQLSVSNEGKVSEESKITYNGLNASQFADAISKRSTLVYLGEQTWNMIQPDKATEKFQPLQLGLVRNILSDPNEPNPNLTFKPERLDIALELLDDNMLITYGRQRQGSTVGVGNWFESDTRRDLEGIFDALFKPSGTFSPHTKMQCKLTIYASSQTSRRVIFQLFKKEAGETTYTPLANGFGGNSVITGTPLVKTLSVSADTFQGVVFDSNDPSLSDTGTKIAQHYPKLSVAPFFPVTCFQNIANEVSTGFILDGDTWTNNAGGVTSTFTELVGNTNGYNWSVATSVGNVLQGTFWKEISPTVYYIKGGDVPMTDPPLYIATLDPTAGTTNPNGQFVVRNAIGGTVEQTINFDGASPVVEETSPMSIFTQGIFNTIEPVAGVQGTADEDSAGAEGGGLGVDLNSNARMFLRGAGGGVSANVANLLGFSNNEYDFTGAAASAGSITSDQEPDQTANNNTLHISIPEMPLVKSFEGENSAEAKSISIIPREEFSTGDTEGSLVYVAPFENWIDINNGQELNMNLITTIVRDADGSLSENLVRETQAVFKIRQDPMKVEEDKKAERLREMAQTLANTINTGLTALIKPQQLIGS